MTKGEGVILITPTLTLPAEGGGYRIHTFLAYSVSRNDMVDRGVQVLHIKFGEGEVLAVEGNKLTIQFASVGRKKSAVKLCEKGWVMEITKTTVNHHLRNLTTILSILFR